MRTGGSLVLVAALAGATACDDPRLPLDLDAIEEPPRPCVSTVHEGLDLGAPLHAYLGDAPGSPGGWALVTLEPSPDMFELGLIRVGASETELELEAIPLGIPPSHAKRIELRRDLAPGVAWLFHDGPSTATVFKLMPGAGVVASNAMIGNFPADDPSPACPDEWHRQLLLIENRPYVLALPDCSEGPALDLHMLELDGDTLDLLTGWVLSFDPCAFVQDPTECAAILAYRIESVGRGQSIQAPAASRVFVGFTQVRAYNDGSGMSTDVSLLDLRLTAGGPVPQLISFRDVWVDDTQPELSAVRITRDPYSIQLHVRSQQEAALLRFDTISELYLLVRAQSHLPLEGRGELFQLDGLSAMVDGSQGVLTAASLLDVDSWPEWEPHEMLELDGLSAIEPAGAGTALLRRTDAPPRVIELACVE